MISRSITTSAGTQERVVLDRLPSRMMNNNVLVRIDFNPTEDVVRDSGIIISGFVNTDWSDSGAMPRFGEVVSVPNKLTFMTPHNIGASNLVEWGTEIEIQEGDTVYFGAMVSANAESLIYDEKLYLLIPYQRLICRLRNGLLTPVNGYCLVREHKKETEHNGIYLANKEKTDRRRGEIIFNGRNNDYYFGEDAVDAEVEVGDDVVFQYNMFGYLENSIFNTIGEDVGFVQKRWIIAKLN